MTLAQTMLRSAISAYRKALSPLLPAACRFHPSCSSYAVEAVERHGALRGSLMSLKRLGRCHPLHPGGFDPVPAPDAERHPGSGVAPTRPPEGMSGRGGEE